MAIVITVPDDMEGEKESAQNHSHDAQNNFVGHGEENRRERMAINWAEIVNEMHTSNSEELRKWMAEEVLDKTPENKGETQGCRRGFCLIRTSPMTQFSDGDPKLAGVTIDATEKSSSCFSPCVPLILI